MCVCMPYTYIQHIQTFNQQKIQDHNMVTLANLELPHRMTLFGINLIKKRTLGWKIKNITPPFEKKLIKRKFKKIKRKNFNI